MGTGVSPPAETAVSDVEYTSEPRLGVRVTALGSSTGHSRHTGEPRCGWWAQPQRNLRHSSVDAAGSSLSLEVEGEHCGRSPRQLPQQGARLGLGLGFALNLRWTQLPCPHIQKQNMEKVPDGVFSAGERANIRSKRTCGIMWAPQRAAHRSTG